MFLIEGALGGGAIRRSHVGFISADNFRSEAGAAEFAGIEPDDAMTEAANLIELMGDKNNRATGLRNFAHFAETLFLKANVADGEHFIDEENFGFEMRSYGESKADIHAAGIMFHGCVDKFARVQQKRQFRRICGRFPACPCREWRR
jgi:hypothetical protein